MRLLTAFLSILLLTWLQLLDVAALYVPVFEDQLPFTAPNTVYSEDLRSLLPFELDSVQALLREHIDSLPELRVVKTGEDKVFVITEGEKAMLTYHGIKFVDVTDLDMSLMMQDRRFSYPANLTHTACQLQPLFDRISVDSMKSFLEEFSSFETRYYRSTEGKKSQEFLLAKVKEIVRTNKALNVSFFEHVHPWGQNSIVARFEPTAALPANATESIVIFSAHLDSINNIPSLPAPGADDDGSGVTTLVEAMKVLANATYAPSTHPVEFHFYSAEEGGLMGSNAVAQTYAKEGKVIRSQFQMDMTAWVKNGTQEVIGVLTDDYVDRELAVFVRKVIDEYATIPWADTTCGYGCSDHYSWYQIGAPAICVSEGSFEDTNLANAHSFRDTIDISPEFSFPHMAQFVRLVIGMAVELGAGAL